MADNYPCNIYMDIYILMDIGKKHDEMKQHFKNNNKQKLAFKVTQTFLSVPHKSKGMFFTFTNKKY